MKIHVNQKSRVIALCDETLIGQVLKDKEIFMDLDKYRGFYVGVKTSKEDVIAELKKGFASANIVGPKSIETAMEAGIIDKNDVRYVKKTPYVQIYRI